MSQIGFFGGSSGGGEGNVNTIDTNSGSATPVAGVINILGTSPISTSGSGNTVTIALATPLTVSDGGTGKTSFTPYAVITGGTTSTNPLQNVVGLGTAGQILTSNGAGALPSWQSSTADGIITLDGDTGSATGATVTIAGGNNITTSAIGSILTIDVNGTTDHAIQVGNSTGSLSSLSVGPNGTVLIGNTGSDPSFSSTPSVTGITIIDAPINPTDGTNKEYVDMISAGFNFKNSTFAGTATDLNATYLNGVSGVGATLTNAGSLAAFSVDGVSPSLNDRILVKNQSSQLENGIYTLTTVGSGAVAWVLTRATDYDTIAEINPGDIVPVEFGTINTTTLWLQTPTVATIGTDSILFQQFFGGGIHTIHTGSGDVVAASGAITITGGSNISTTGSASTVNVNISGTTDHAIQLGNSTGNLTSLGVATNGQLPIGSTGTDPVLAVLTAATGINVTNGAGSITISTSGVINLTYTAVSTSPYVVLSTDSYIGVNSSGGARTIQLPNAPATGKVYIVKDSAGSSVSNNITITTVGGSVTIDGATTFVMNSAYQAVQVIFNGTSYEIF